VRLFTHLVVREDAHLLYGFGTDGEAQVFRQLIRITGIGARIALPRCCPACRSTSCTQPSASRTACGSRVSRDRQEDGRAAAARTEDKLSLVPGAAPVTGTAMPSSNDALNA
jgi:Holliday junction DNA helicase RuvA